MARYLVLYWLKGTLTGWSAHTPEGQAFELVRTCKTLLLCEPSWGEGVVSFVPRSSSILLSEGITDQRLAERWAELSALNGTPSGSRYGHDAAKIHAETFVCSPKPNIGRLDLQWLWSLDGKQSMWLLDPRSQSTKAGCRIPLCKGRIFIVSRDSRPEQPRGTIFGFPIQRLWRLSMRIQRDAFLGGYWRR